MRKFGEGRRYRTFRHRKGVTNKERNGEWILMQPQRAVVQIILAVFALAFCFAAAGSFATNTKNGVLLGALFWGLCLLTLLVGLVIFGRD